MKFKLFLAIFSITVIFISYLIQLHNSECKIKQLENKIDSLKNFHSTIEVMAKTLQIEYNISLPMAKYSSYIFYDFSQKYKLPWEIYASCVKIESGWNPTLVSSSKARGLMQLIEGTAKARAAKLGIKYSVGVTEWNDIENMVMGCDYLSEGYDTSNGFKKYIGGENWKQTTDSKHVETMDKYSLDAKIEFRKLELIYKGLLYEEKK